MYCTGGRLIIFIKLYVLYILLYSVGYINNFVSLVCVCVCICVFIKFPLRTFMKCAYKMIKLIYSVPADMKSNIRNIRISE